MNGEPVKVYDAENGPAAELLREALEAEGIEAAIDTIPSPLDGLTAMGQGTPVFVGANDTQRALEVIEKTLTEHVADDDFDDLAEEAENAEPEA